MRLFAALLGRYSCAGDGTDLGAGRSNTVMTGRALPSSSNMPRLAMQAAGDGRLPPEDALAAVVRRVQDDAIDLVQELLLPFGRLGERAWACSGIRSAASCRPPRRR